jgi:hypothetical protein
MWAGAFSIDGAEEFTMSLRPELRAVNNRGGVNAVFSHGGTFMGGNGRVVLDLGV